MLYVGRCCFSVSRRAAARADPVASVSTALILPICLGIGGAIRPPWVYLTNRGERRRAVDEFRAYCAQLRLEAAHAPRSRSAAALAERRVSAAAPLCASCKSTSDRTRLAVARPPASRKPRLVLPRALRSASCLVPRTPSYSPE